MKASTQHPALRPARARARVVLVALAATWAFGCGQEVTMGGADGGFGAGATVDPACSLAHSAHVPPDPGADPPTGTQIVFALSDLRVNTDTQGNFDPTAWRRLGHDIDCRITTAESTDVCKPTAYGSVRVDGDEGRDNSLGPLLAGSSGSDINAGASISSGEWTLLFRFPALDDGSRRSAVAVEIAEGGALGHAPAFDGTDVWPAAAPTVLKDGYVADSLWVSGSSTTVRLRLLVEGEPLYLTLHHAVFTARFSADLSGADYGQIAGILDPSELDAELHRVTVLAVPEFCSKPPNPVHADELADILLDGTQDPSVTCNGISFGAGFSLRRAVVGPETSPAVPTPDPCPSPNH